MGIVTQSFSLSTKYHDMEVKQLSHRLSNLCRYNDLDCNCVQYDHYLDVNISNKRIMRNSFHATFCGKVWIKEGGLNVKGKISLPTEVYLLLLGISIAIIIFIIASTSFVGIIKTIATLGILFVILLGLFFGGFHFYMKDKQKLGEKINRVLELLAGE